MSYEKFEDVRQFGHRSCELIHAEIGFYDPPSRLYNARSNSNLWLNKAVWWRRNPDAEY
jgi:hypothetical protein